MSQFATPKLSCRTCKQVFENADDNKLHRQSQWHRYNLKRKVEGLEGVTEEEFLATQSRLSEEENKKLEESRMLYTCGLCCKDYRSRKAYAQHLISRSHVVRARVTRGANPHIEYAIIRPFVRNKETGSEEATSPVSTHDDNGCDKQFDPTQCFMCDFKNPTIEASMIHMRKKHGFLIPGTEYLKDPKGLLTYLGLQVTRDFSCLYCSERCHPFSSLEAVRKHMEAKCHFRVRYGDEKVALEQFYEFSNRHVENDAKQMVAGVNVDGGDNSIQPGRGGFELILKRTTDYGISAKILGSRQFSRYYKQHPPARRTFTKSADKNTMRNKLHLATRAESRGLSAMQARKIPGLRMRMYKQMRRFGKDAMMTRVSFKSNKLRCLPKNCAY